MTEENIIRQMDSGRRPFTTPDGYFDGLTERIMQRLPERQGQPVRAKVVPLNPVRRFMRYAAAIAVAVACIGGGTLLYNRLDTMDLTADASEYLFDDDNINDMLDYEMLDNNQIAYYLTEAY